MRIKSWQVDILIAFGTCVIIWSWTEQVKKSEELIVGLQKEVNTSKLEVLEAKEDCVKVFMALLDISLHVD